MGLIMKYAHVMCLASLRNLARTVKLCHMVPETLIWGGLLQETQLFEFYRIPQKIALSSVKNTHMLVSHLSHCLIDLNHFLIDFFAC